MKTFSIGFVGGCLAHQPGIPFPRLFHRVAGRRLEDERGMRLRLSVSRDLHMEPRHRAACLIRDSQTDAIILHRSTSTFFCKATAVFVTHGDRYVVNPFLFRRSGRRSWLDHERNAFRDCLSLWRPKATADEHAPQAVEAEPRLNLDPPVIPAETLLALHEAGLRRRLRFKDLLWLIPEWTGLTDWAIADELRIVRETHEECMAASVPLIVMGPGLRVGLPWVNRLARRLEDVFTNWAVEAADGGYVSLLDALPGSRSPGPLGPDHYCDQVHFNAAGHEHVAARLEPVLERLVRPLIED